MKRKILSLILCASMMCSPLAAFADEIETETETSGEITFRDIPWGSSYTEVDSMLQELNLWTLTGEIYKTFSVDDLAIGDYEGIDFENSDINIVANAMNGEISVAGYTTSAVSLYFAYIPVDGVLTKTEDDSALYGARYEFEPNDLLQMKDDLIEKLSILYGKPNETATDSDWLGLEYEYTYWYGDNDTEVVLKATDASSDDSSLYEDEIYITYIWAKGDELLQTASDTISQNDKDAEAELYGNGSTDGL